MSEQVENKTEVTKDQANEMIDIEIKINELMTEIIEKNGESKLTDDLCSAMMSMQDAQDVFEVDSE